MKVYVYKGTEYRTERSVREAIFKEQRIAFPKIESDEQWATFNVEVVDKPHTQSQLTVEQLISRYLDEVRTKFERFRTSSSTYIESALGFTANANTTAFENVTGLIAQIKYRVNQGEQDPVVLFKGYDNEVHQLNLVQLEQLQAEISMYGSKAYQYKWTKKEQIRACTTKEQLGEIVFDLNEIGH